MFFSKDNKKNDPQKPDANQASGRPAVPRSVFAPGVNPNAAPIDFGLNQPQQFTYQAPPISVPPPPTQPFDQTSGVEQLSYELPLPAAQSEVQWEIPSASVEAAPLPVDLQQTFENYVPLPPSSSVPSGELPIVEEAPIPPDAFSSASWPLPEPFAVEPSTPEASLQPFQDGAAYHMEIPIDPFPAAELPTPLPPFQATEPSLPEIPTEAASNLSHDALDQSWANAPQAPDPFWSQEVPAFDNGLGLSPAELLDTMHERIYPENPLGNASTDLNPSFLEGEQAFAEAAQYLFPDTIHTPLHWEENNHSSAPAQPNLLDEFSLPPHIDGLEDFGAPSSTESPLDLGPSIQESTGAFTELAPLPEPDPFRFDINNPPASKDDAFLFPPPVEPGLPLTGEAAHTSVAGNTGIRSEDVFHVPTPAESFSFAPEPEAAFNPGSTLSQAGLPETSLPETSLNDYLDFAQPGQVPTEPLPSPPLPLTESNLQAELPLVETSLSFFEATSSTADSLPFLSTPDYASDTADEDFYATAFTLDANGEIIPSSLDYLSDIDAETAQTYPKPIAPPEPTIPWPAPMDHASSQPVIPTPEPVGFQPDFFQPQPHTPDMIGSQPQPSTHQGADLHVPPWLPSEHTPIEYHNVPNTPQYEPFQLENSPTIESQLFPGEPETFDPFTPSEPLPSFNPFQEAIPTLETPWVSPASASHNLPEPEAQTTEPSPSTMPGVNFSLNNVEVLGMCPLDDHRRLLLVQGQDTFALIGQVGLETPQVFLLKTFDHNPLAYQNTFTAVAEAQTQDQGMFVTQVGTWHAIISTFQDKITLHTEIG